MSALGYEQKKTEITVVKRMTLVDISATQKFPLRMCQKNYKVCKVALNFTYPS